MRRAADNLSVGTDVDEVMQDAVAASRTTFPHPNPRVAAALVTANGDVRRMSVHEGPGHPHAEVLALDGPCDPSDTLVVTLEPCNHFGRTPPCTDAILASGVRRVVIGARDPDTRVQGSGVAALRDAGITVIDETAAELVESADPAYFRQRRTDRPWITLKAATTLDGQIAAADGSSQWITNAGARRDAHELRARHAGVMVGVGTVIADNPRLDVRLDGYDGPQPRPVVVTGRRGLPDTAAVGARDPLVVRGGSADNMIDVLAKVSAAGIGSVLVEGGPRLLRSFVANGNVDEFVWYLGPKFAGGSGRSAFDGAFATLSDAIEVDIDRVQVVDGNVRVTARPKVEVD